MCTNSYYLGRDRAWCWCWCWCWCCVRETHIRVFWPISGLLIKIVRVFRSIAPLFFFDFRPLHYILNTHPGTGCIALQHVATDINSSQQILTSSTITIIWLDGIGNKLNQSILTYIFRQNHFVSWRTSPDNHSLPSLVLVTVVAGATNTSDMCITTYRNPLLLMCFLVHKI